MNIRGVCYDVGRVMLGRNWRPDFDRVLARRELSIIRDDLHCNAVRLCGRDLDRLTTAAEEALAVGLDVWFSPELWDEEADDTCAYIVTAAERAETLRRDHEQELVFSVGSELTLFMNGIVPGDNVLDRLSNPAFWELVRSGAHNQPLKAFLTKTVASVRKVFHGRVTYAAVPLELEAVDWSEFDIVATDLYRDARTRDIFPELARRPTKHGKPAVITEFGCCTYRGAADAGGMGWNIVDSEGLDGPGDAPKKLNSFYQRDEDEQARDLQEHLEIFADARLAGAFAFTFVEPTMPSADDPVHDLDLASYSLVRTMANGHGTTYPDMTWEPKRAFWAVAESYGQQDSRSNPKR